jgi:dCMP deaminase
MNKHKYFMQIAHAAAERSKDPNTKVGAIIVGPNDEIVSTGYNGLPRKINDDQLFWGQKEHFVIHAELNAILHAKQSVQGCTLYSTHHPCISCTKVLVQCGISTIYWTTMPDRERYNIDLAEKLLDEVEIFRRKLL